jgi:hypothetical protein
MSEGLARQGFDLDLNHGEARESAFVKALTNCHVECKADQKARSTGNVCIETHQRGRPSGINVTTANVWAIEYADDCWVVIRTSLLKMLVRRARADNRTTMGGDFNAFRLVLVPIPWLFNPLTLVATERKP